MATKQKATAQEAISWPIIPGAIHVYGATDAGKTMFALEGSGPDPSRVLFFDFDVKGQVANRQLLALDMGMQYHDLNIMRYGRKPGKNEAEITQDIRFYNEFMKLLSTIVPGSADTVIWDTWALFSKIITTHVQQYPNIYRSKEGYAPQGQIAMSQKHQEAGWHEARIINWMLANVDDGGLGAKSVFLVSHMKGQHVKKADGNSVATGKMIPDIGNAVLRSATARFYLQRKPGATVPTAIVMKHPAVVGWDDAKKRISTIQYLPEKIVPQSEDTSLWDAIGRFKARPWGPRPAEEKLESEFLSPEDIDDISQKMTKDEYALLMASLGNAAPKGLTTQVEVMQTNSQIAEMVLTGAKDAEIMEKLGVTKPMILAAKTNLPLGVTT